MYVPFTSVRPKIHQKRPILAPKETYYSRLFVQPPISPWIDPFISPSIPPYTHALSLLSRTQVVGIPWHPEDLTPEKQQLFKAVIAQLAGVSVTSVLTSNVRDISPCCRGLLQEGIYVDVAIQVQRILICKRLCMRIYNL
jgi:hypothetical protein